MVSMDRRRHRERAREYDHRIEWLGAKVKADRIAAVTRIAHLIKFVPPHTH